MSALLLDTHIWLWYAEGTSEQLRSTSVKILDEARRKDGLLVSAISVWEIGALSAKGRIQLSIPLRDWAAKALEVSGDYQTATMPPVNQGLLNGRLAWRQHDGGHTDAPNMKYFIEWADRFIGHTPGQP